MDIDDLIEEGGKESSQARPTRSSRFAPKAAAGLLQPISVKKEEDSGHFSLHAGGNGVVAAESEAQPKPEEGEQMDEDRTDNDVEEDDYVVCAYDVYFNPPSRDNDTKLYVLQYPLRPCWRPYDLEQSCTEVRVKAKSAEVQVDLTLDVQSENYDMDAPTATKMEKQTLSSSWKPSQTTGYAAGVLRDKKLYLNPVHAVVQLRPLMCYLDSLGSKKRNIPEVSVKAADLTGELLVGPSKRQNKQMEPQVAEPWVPLKYHGLDSDLSSRYLQKMVDEASSPLQFSMSPHDYLNSLCPRAVVCKRKPNGPSMRALLSLPLEERLKIALAEGPPVQRFSVLKHLAPDHPIEDVLRILQQLAHLVQGVWVAKTAIRCPNAQGSQSLVRDYALLLFSQSPTIKTSTLNVLGSRKANFKDLLSELAIERPYCQDWKFREPTDISFIKLYPDIVREQEELWKNREKRILDAVLGDKNRHNSRSMRTDETTKQGTSLSDKGPSKVTADACTRRLAISEEIREALVKVLRKFFQTHKVCSFHTICQGLRDIAVSMSTQPKMDARAARAVKSGAEAPQEELEKVISEIAINVHGLYVLRSSLEHPEFDPLRNIVIDLFIGKGSNAKLKKAEVMEAARIKLGKEPTNNEFLKVLGEFCVSKGGAWVLKSGDGAPK
ncbi:hypothetical protein Ancab_026126 [Ancistrocladus abbreviatus]